MPKADQYINSTKVNLMSKSADIVISTTLVLTRIRLIFSNGI